MTSVRSNDVGNFTSHEVELDQATSDLKEALRDIAMETAE